MARSKGVRRVRRGFVQRNEHFWTSIIENATDIAPNVLRFTPIVGPTDWVVRAGAATATLVRIRGHISVALDISAAPGGCSLTFAVIVVDADDAVNFNPMTLVSLNENQVLWTRTKQLLYFGDIANGAQVPEENFVLDVKVRRKLRPDDYVYLVTFNGVTPLAADRNVRLHCVARGLVVVK